MSAKSMTLYVKTICPWCRVAEDYLHQHGYKYERIDVRADRAAFDDLRRISGQSRAPTLVVGDLVLPDFGTDELEDFLKRHNIQP
jgi:glutaredoxin 3